MNAQRRIATHIHQLGVPIYVLQGCCGLHRTAVICMHSAASPHTSTGLQYQFMCCKDGVASAFRGSTVVSRPPCACFRQPARTHNHTCGGW
eukprot:12149463-Alexandrium_andersonii.AAC.1